MTKPNKNCKMYCENGESMNKKLFTKKNVVTIPNLLSLMRLVLIPFICYEYFKLHDYVATAVLVVVSAVTDIVDGIIARKFGMVSDLGKMLDPLADKLTEGVLILALSFTYKYLLPLVVSFTLFEVSKAILGMVVVKKTGEVRGAKWFGKINTVYLYETILVMIVFRNAPDNVIFAKMIVAFALMLASFILYIIAYSKALKELKIKQEEEKNALGTDEETLQTFDNSAEKDIKTEKNGNDEGNCA